MENFIRPVAYMEDHDFDASGNLTNRKVPKNKPVVIMVQASWCPHCSQAKPAFQEFAEKNEGKVFCATIQADGEKKSEVELGRRIEKLKPEFKGFPDYLLYENGRIIDKEIKGRDVKSLEEFIIL